MKDILRAAVVFVHKMSPPPDQQLPPKEGSILKPFNRLLPLAVLATLCSSSPMRADEQVPFKGAFNPVILAVTPIDPGHVRLDLAVDVMATQLGKAHGPAPVTMDLATLSYVGQVTWTAANRDAISITFAGQFVPTTTPGVLENVETFEIVGGTGRFEGATGAGIVGGHVDAATLVPLTPAPFIGTISSPGSLKR